MVLENPLATFAQGGKGNPEGAIGGFGAGDGLKKKIDGCAAVHCGELRGDVSEAAGLRGRLRSLHKTVETVKDGADRFDGARCRIHANDGVAATVEEAFKCSEKNTSKVIDRMVGLNANAENTPLAESIAAASDIADFCGGKDKV